MKLIPFVAAALLLPVALASAAGKHVSRVPAVPANSAEKRVLRIDSLIATRKGGQIVLQAKGAVSTGGWSRARLHLLHSDSRVMTVEFVATPPPPEMTVIDGLVPMTATAMFKGRAESVHVQADANEITSQVLR
ncbi:MAG TPA: hypothetical protein VKB67_07195 [Rhizomicrobium sp.]|nr:hypothetical protein [Rhizomicrobium sp.]